MNCPACGSTQHQWLGILGRRAHFKCRDCGMGYSTDADNINEDDGSELDEWTLPEVGVRHHERRAT